MRTWDVQRRLVVAFALGGTVVTAVVVAAALAFISARTAQDRVIDDYYPATRLSHDAFVRVVDVEAAVQEYLRTGDPAALQPLEEARESDLGDRLRALLADDDVSKSAFEEASAVTRGWFDDWAVPAMATVRAGGPEALSDAEEAEGERRFEEVRSSYAMYTDVLAAQRERAVSSLLHRMAALFGAVVAVALASGAVALFLGWGLRRWVARPLAELADHTRLVREGALDHRVAVTGPPDVERLAEDVDGMRSGLVEEIAAARTATYELQLAKGRLEAQAAELERSNRDLEQFAYVASHDLQEPLRKVASFCQLLQRRYAGQLDDRADQYIEFAVDGAKRMQQLINDLLAFSRVGRLTTPETDVDLGRCLDRALRDLETAVAETGAVVTRDELPVVRGEAPLLKQLFVNLVGNAVKFRSTEPPRIHIGVRAAGEFWELSCSDNGIGVEPQYAERIFIIFQRLHPRDVYGGTGIGLALCKKIVEYHGGRIWVDSASGGAGTTIRWTLPVRSESAPDQDGRPARQLAAVPAGTATTRSGSGGPHVS